MKKMSQILFFSLLLFSCSKTGNQNELNLKNLDLELNIEVNKASVENTPSNISNIIDELTDRIFSSPDDGSETIYVKNFGSELQITITEPGSNDVPTFEGKPCKEEKKTCRSRECVKDTLAEILGDGTRDVVITYKKHTFSVELIWQYQDC